MASFTSFSERMEADVQELHDYVWSPGWDGNEASLRTRLLEDAKELDEFLATGGSLATNAEAPAEEWGRGTGGSGLFELLYHTYALTAARELLKERQYKAAAERAARVAESASIGVCAAADCFEIVDEWERGGGDFETYTKKLADELEGKGVSGGRDFCRLTLAVGKLGKEWDSRISVETHGLAAQAAIANAAWCAALAVHIRGDLGAAPSRPYDDLPEILQRISLG